MVIFRALTSWGHEETPADDRRTRYAFKAPWSNTLDLLRAELGQLNATDIVIGVALRPSDIRLDGWPRSNARAPEHPGVEVSFNSDRDLHPLAHRGRELINRYGGVREAQMKCHPDHGDPADFVAISAAADKSRQIYGTDCCVFWEHNVRSIALGLQALRAVDRYGISRRGEQYAGFRAALTA